MDVDRTCVQDTHWHRVDFNALSRAIRHHVRWFIATTAHHDQWPAWWPIPGLTLLMTIIISNPADGWTIRAHWTVVPATATRWPNNLQNLVGRTNWFVNWLIARSIVVGLAPVSPKVTLRLELVTICYDVDERVCYAQCILLYSSLACIWCRDLLLSMTYWHSAYYSLCLFRTSLN